MTMNHCARSETVPSQGFRRWKGTMLVITSNHAVKA